MGSPAELTLEVRPPTNSPSSAFKSVPLSGDQLERMGQLQEYLKALEDERRKIEAFKRELPFCMQLLNDAIESSKEQLGDFQPLLHGSQQVSVSCNFEEDSSLKIIQSGNARIMLEENMPLKKKNYDSSNVGIDGRQQTRIQPYVNGEKPNWMARVKSWNVQPGTDPHGQEKAANKQRESVQPGQEPAFNSASKLFLHSKQRVGGAFLPFSRDRQVIQPSAKMGAINVPDLAPSSGEHEVSPHREDEESGSLLNQVRESLREGVEQQGKRMTVRTDGALVGTANDSNTVGSQSQRKARRCWSPELHRRFINALQQLGGSQVATPKQIRELMKIDGLTNDEVKSHLQKYRLHTRRPSPAPQTTPPHAPQLVVLGGIWVPSEYAAHAAAAAQQAPAIYNPQQAHICQPTLSQDFYSQLNSSTQLQMHSSVYYDQQQVATAAHSQSSPQGPLQLAGQSSNGGHISGDAGREESVGEDVKSENSSWKGEDQEENLQEAQKNEDQRSINEGLTINKRRQRYISDEYDPDLGDSRGNSRQCGPL